MAIARWLARRSDGLFVSGGFRDTQNSDPVLFVLVDFVDENPDPRLDRWDGNKGKRAATPAELAAYDSDQMDGQIDQFFIANSPMGKAFRALAQATYELKTTVWTQPQFFARIRQIFKNL